MALLVKQFLVYQKQACDCVGATATAGMTRFEFKRLEEDKVVYSVTYYPMNSCNCCGIPWKVKCLEVTETGSEDVEWQ